MKTKTDIAELIKQHIGSIDSKAEIILLNTKHSAAGEEKQIYVLTLQKVDLNTEQAYENARYEVEMKSGESLTLYIYPLNKWHKQFKDTPIYKKLDTEGLLLN